MNLKAWLNPLFAIKRLNYAIYEYWHPDEPWIAQGAVRFCKQQLSKDQVMLEWGSGRSTIWFAERVKHLTCVEHDELWYGRVARCISAKNQSNISYLFRPLHHSPQVGIPFKEQMATPYVQVAALFEKESLDAVIIDGHYREACINAILEKLKPSGLLMVDNTDWLPLEKWGVPPDWPIIHQSRNVMTQTTIWRKP